MQGYQDLSRSHHQISLRECYRYGEVPARFELDIGIDERGSNHHSECPPAPHGHPKPMEIDSLILAKKVIVRSNRNCHFVNLSGYHKPVLSDSFPARGKAMKIDLLIQPKELIVQSVGNCRFENLPAEKPIQIVLILG